jgi:hypothetical protein
VQRSGIADSIEKLAITRVSISSVSEASDYLDLISDVRFRSPIGRPRLQPPNISRVVLDAVASHRARMHIAYPCRRMHRRMNS